MLSAFSRTLLSSTRGQSNFLAGFYRSASSTGAPKVLTPELKTQIDSLLKNNDVVVFMKGTADEPACGFSRNVKLILDFHEVPFKGVNVLENEEIRHGVKEYSEWPTIPQVFVKGEFVGGSDILVQMHKEGEITDYLESKGIKSKFSEQ